MMWVTVIYRAGYAIQINLDARYYRVNHADFAGRRFDFAQNAVDAIDNLTKE